MTDSARLLHSVPVAQLDRASASEAEGRTFDSYRAHHFNSSKSFTEVLLRAGAGTVLVVPIKSVRIITMVISALFPSHLGNRNAPHAPVYKVENFSKKWICDQFLKASPI